MRNPPWIHRVAACLLLQAGCSTSDEAPAPVVQQQVPFPNAAPTLLELEGPQGHIDSDYTFQLSTPDATVRSWTLVDGELPAGLTVSAEGLVQGKPSATGVRRALLHGQGGCGDLSCRVQVRLSIPIAEVILVSGFGPFAGMPVNPSWQSVEPLGGTSIGGYDVRVIQVPVVWDEAMPVFFDEYYRVRPAMAIGSGVAMGYKGIRLENVARNVAGGVDEANDTWPTAKIDESGPDTYGPLLPLTMLLARLKEAEFSASISSNAGDYLCNFLFYGLMKQLRAENQELHVFGGFVHVPGPEAIAPDKMTEAWKVMLGRLAEYRTDLLATHRAPDDSPAIPTLHDPPIY